MILDNEIMDKAFVLLQEMMPHYDFNLFTNAYEEGPVFSIKHFYDDVREIIENENIKIKKVNDITTIMWELL